MGNLKDFVAGRRVMPAWMTVKANGFVEAIAGEFGIEAARANAVAGVAVPPLGTWSGSATTGAD